MGLPAVAGYYHILVLSFLMLTASFSYLWYIYRKKQTDNYKIENGEIVATTLFILLAGSLFVSHLLDLPDVLANRTEEYQGECEVWVFDGSRSGHNSVHFDDKKIRFPLNYHGVQEGSYYCEVTYYPNTETGASLMLYTEKGGESITSK